MRIFLWYTLVLFVFVGLYLFFWDGFSDVWKKLFLVIGTVFLVFLGKDLLLFVFRFLKQWAAFLISLFLVFLLGWFGYSHVPNWDIWGIGKEIKNDIVEFFALPSLDTPETDVNDVVHIQSTSEGERKIGKGDVDVSYRVIQEDVHSFVDGTINPTPEMHELDPALAVLLSESKQGAEYLLDEEKRESFEVIDTSEGSLGVETDPLLFLLQSESDAGRDNTQELQNEFKQSEQVKNDNTADWKEPVVEIPSPYDFINSSTTPLPEDGINKKEKEGIPQKNNVLDSDEEDTVTKVEKELVTHGILPSSGKNQERSVIPFSVLPVQISYPAEYTFQMQDLPKNSFSRDGQSFLIQNPQGKSALMVVNIYTEGSLYEKYFERFVTAPNPGKNTFYLESQSLNTVQYVSFFDGNVWSISIRLNEKNASYSDFYTFLLPAVFEDKE